MTRRSLAMAVAALGLVATTAAAQGSRTLHDDAGTMSFEVASIKPNRGLSDKSLGTGEPGQFKATGVTLHDLIAASYGGIPGRLGDARIVDEPSWFTSQRWDVTARTAPENGLDKMFLMVETLLRERFGLRLAIEQREGPAFALTVSRRDGRLGEGLTRSTIDCATLLPQVLATGKWPEGVEWCGWRYQRGDLLHVEARGVTMAELAARLEQSPNVGRPVVDRTQLSGAFDLSFDYSLLPPGGAAPGDQLSIFTALDERLGLKLSSERAAVDVFAVTAAHLPDPD